MTSGAGTTVPGGTKTPLIFIGAVGAIGVTGTAGDELFGGGLFGG